MKLDEPARKDKYYDLLAESKNSETTDPVNTDQPKNVAGSDLVKDDTTVDPRRAGIIEKWNGVLAKKSLPLTTEMIPMTQVIDYFNEEMANEDNVSFVKSSDWNQDG